MPDLGSLMQMAQKLQGDMARMQEELAQRRCEASAGGGMVSAVVNGAHELVELRIDRSVVDPADVGMLQDLIVAAVNQAHDKVRSMTRDEMNKLSGGLGLPGLGGLIPGL
jgi:hypothetical protein